MLFATTGGQGHFLPMVPLARAVAEAGHDVRVAAPDSFAKHVAPTGLRHEPFGDADPAALGAVFGALPGLSPQEANARVMTEVFGRLDPVAALPAVASLVDRWRPDLVVREPAELASLVAAEAAGVPHAQVAIGLRSLLTAFVDELTGPLAALAAGAGIDHDLAAAAAAEPVFTSVPSSFDDDHDDVPPVRYRIPASSAPAPPLPAWGDPDAPLVYVSFGTVAAAQGFDGAYAAAVEAMAEVDVRALVTVGAHGDPEAWAPWPRNVHVERWWPQEAVMPDASAMVGHGGFGTTTMALGAGVPQVVVPLFASDQWINASRVAELQAGIALEAGRGLADRLRPALHAVLHDARYRAAARGLADEMGALPPPSAIVGRLMALAR
ncbi:glycosyltransferase, MGT family [Krasilnikoviella flava]|uniref:Glycosyltransferase, MGT family n=1 Tax=Krasilnikoviella flava TaxID=526729 RepID=A0A1T5JK58_9MICO|nr:glycosyltransferase, MGT family [Krasilnikoviella flava]